MIKRSWLLCFVLAACSSAGGTGSHDAAVMDLAPVCVPAGAEVCDGVDNDCNGKIDDGLTPSTANKRQYVATVVSLPSSKAEFALDLNGDGKPDNQLGSIVQVLTFQMFDANAQLQQAILDGNEIVLIDWSSSDPTDTTDSCAAAGFYNGVPKMMPDLTGNGSFTVDPSAPAGHFSGVIAAGVFSSPLPTSGAPPVSMQLGIPMGSQFVKLPMFGAHITFKKAGAMISGQLNGAVRDEDVQRLMVPAITKTLNDRIQSMPTSAQTRQTLLFFDNGGSPPADMACADGSCKNPDGTCAMKNDGKIDLCEVSTNSATQTVLAPDVQMFALDGTTYAPNPSNVHLDSLSVGIAFTAVPAKF